MLSQRWAPGPFGGWGGGSASLEKTRRGRSSPHRGAPARERPGGLAERRERAGEYGAEGGGFSSTPLAVAPNGGKPVRRPHWPSGWKGGANAHAIGPATPEERCSETPPFSQNKVTPFWGVGGRCGGCRRNPAVL